MTVTVAADCNGSRRMARGGFHSVDSLQGVPAIVVSADRETRTVLSAVASVVRRS